MFEADVMVVKTGVHASFTRSISCFTFGAVSGESDMEPSRPSYSCLEIGKVSASNGRVANLHQHFGPAAWLEVLARELDG